MIKMTPAKVVISLACLCLCLAALYSSSEPYRKTLRENREAKYYLNLLVNEINNADQINVVEASCHFETGAGDAAKEIIPLPIETRQITLNSRRKIDFSKIVQATNPAPKREFGLCFSEVNHTVEFLQKGKIHSVLRIGFFSEDIHWDVVGPGNDLQHIAIYRYPKDLLPCLRQWIFSLGLNPDVEKEAWIKRMQSAVPNH